MPVQTHDYTQRYWGHDYATLEVRDKGLNLTMSGWGTGIREGDYLILPNGRSTTRYQVNTIKYCIDPSDMWFAEVSFAPRSSPSNSATDREPSNPEQQSASA